MEGCAGVYTTGPLTINISGVAALNPAMAGQVQTNPALAGLMFGSINQAAVPIEEGWVKLRGLDPSITKEDICTFFQVRPPFEIACKYAAVLWRNDGLCGGKSGAVLFGALPEGFTSSDGYQPAKRDVQDEGSLL